MIILLTPFKLLKKNDKKNCLTVVINRRYSMQGGLIKKIRIPIPAMINAEVGEV